jgi:hypothetical protein
MAAALQSSGGAGGRRRVGRDYFANTDKFRGSTKN